MAKDYNLNRALKLERIYGKPFEIRINDEAPFRCVSKMTIPQFIAHLNRIQEHVTKTGSLEGYSEVEVILRAMIDPADHDRLHEGFTTSDPAKVILLDLNDCNEVAKDLATYLSGGDLPLGPLPLLSDGELIPGSDSPESSPPEGTVTFG